IGINAALGNAPLAISGGTIWADGGARTVATPLLLAGNTITLGGRRDFGGTFGLEFTNARPLTLQANTTLNLDDPLTPVRISGNLSENLPGRALSKGGIGTLTLAGSNTYTGATNVNAGVLKVQNNNALGAKTEELQAIIANGPFELSFTNPGGLLS